MLDMIESIHMYFNWSNPSMEEDPSLFRRYLEVWNDAYVPAAIAVIVDRLRRTCDTTAVAFAVSPDAERYGNLILTNHGQACLFALGSAVLLTGNGAFERLVSMVSHKEADFAAVAALVLSLPTILRPQAKGPVEQRLRQARGSSLKIALSVTLYQLGYSSPLRENMLPLSSKPDHARDFASQMQGFDRTADRELLEDIALSRSVVPAIDTVLWDIATQGRHHRYLYGKDWVRE